MNVSLICEDHVTRQPFFPVPPHVPVGFRKLECRSDMVWLSPHTLIPSLDVY